MNDLSSIIGNGELLQVDIEIRPIAKVLSLINDHLKAQNRRLTIIEDEIKSFVRKEDYDRAYDALIKRIALTEDKMAQTVSRFSGLSSDVQSIENKFNKTLDDHLSEMLVTTNTKIRNAQQGFDSQIQIVNSQLAELKGKLKEPENPQNKVDLAVFGAFIKQNTVDIAELKNQLSHQHQGNSAISTGTKATTAKTGDFKDIDTSGLNMSISDNSSLLSQVNQQKRVLLELVSELNKVKEKVDMPITAPPQIIETKTIIEKEIQQADTSNRRNMIGKLAAAGGNLNTVQLETELSKLENDFDSHQSKVVAAMNAIQFELQQIRDHGEGLAGLPPLNLANVVPSFFNNPSFTFSRPSEATEEEDLSSESTRTVATDDNIKDNKKQSNTRENRRTDGRMIYRRELASEDSDICLTPRREDYPQVPRDDRIYDSPSAMTERSEINYVQQEIDYDRIIDTIKKEIDFDTIRDTFSKFQKDHTETMAALERKIDREYVERLFDKFRQMIHSLNDRVKELADFNSDFATHQDFQNLLLLVKNMPKENRPGTALKKGPSCLFCGRPKSSLAGSISAKDAANAGKPPVRSVLSDGAGVEYVYGEGQAFRRDEANFQSFPHFEILPPLSKKTQPNTSASTPQ